MIRPINPISPKPNFLYQPNIMVQSQTEFETKPFELSGAEVGRAILARNNVSFRNLAMPIEVTDKYNKNVSGKDHLNLPNIHIYEYPDTNLQVFLDINKNIPVEEYGKVTIAIKNTDSTKTNVEREFIKKLLIKNLHKQPKGLKINRNSHNEIIINVGNINNKYNDFAKINKAITNFDITEEEFIEAKKEFIKQILSKKNKNIAENISKYFDKSEIIPEIEVVKSIQKFEYNQFKNDYVKYMKNSELSEYITINSKHLNNDTKVQLFKELNDDLNIRFSKHNSKNINTPDFKINTMRKYINKNTDNLMETKYPFPDNTIKEHFIASYANFIIIFLSSNFNLENSEIEDIPNIVNIKSNNNTRIHNIYFENEGNKNIEEGLKKQKELFRNICEIDFTNTLNSLKEFFIEEFDNNTNSKDLSKVHSLLYDYDYEIFNIKQIINSITTDDIKNYIRTYLINQEPIVASSYIKEDL